jgi:hypothetical protein
MIIAATKPTIPASPKDCTKPIMFEANASRDITTFVRLSKIDVSPAIAFMFSPIFFSKYQNESFRVDMFILSF